jgi:hypothetical protein
MSNGSDPSRLEIPAVPMGTSEPATGHGRSKEGGRSGLTVEYQAASHPHARVAEAVAREREAAIEADLSADATVVLPLSALPAKSRRHDNNGDKRGRS